MLVNPPRGLGTLYTKKTKSPALLPFLPPFPLSTNNFPKLIEKKRDSSTGEKYLKAGFFLFFGISKKVFFSRLGGKG